MGGGHPAQPHPFILQICVNSCGDQEGDTETFKDDFSIEKSSKLLVLKNISGEAVSTHSILTSS